MRRLFFITLALVITFTISLISPVMGEQSKAQAPGFTLSDLNGKKVSLSDFKGKVVLINFWATWCGPCRDEMPALNKIYLEYKDKGFVVLAISIDTSEKPVKSFVSEKKISFPVLMDKNREVSFDTYGAMGMPTSFLIDRNGFVVEKMLGEMEWDSPQIRKLITNLFGDKK